MEGLTTQEAAARLQKYGPNTLPEEKHHPFLDFLHKFWAPIPWLLELIIALEIYLSNFVGAWVIFALLLFNAAVSFLEEGKAKNALTLLRNQLTVLSSVLRDKQWMSLPASEIVPGDIISLRMGEIVPADATLRKGAVLIDQSALTGESLPVQPPVGSTVYAGSIVKHGEAFAEVTATAKNTYFGKTAEIMSAAKAPTHLEKTIFTIIKYLIAFDVVLVAVVFAYAYYNHLPFSELVPFSALLLVASVPMALPATFTLATALGSIELAKSGVLVTRLAAIEEAAAMNVLCVDKTGTITQNTLRVSALRAYPPYTDDDLLILGSLACEESTQDPIDLAILGAARNRKSSYSFAEIQKFIPFDPARKCSEAILNYHNEEAHVFKGAPHELAKILNMNEEYAKDLEILSMDGSRVLGVIFGSQRKYELVGLIALMDPPRDTSKPSIREIQDLGVRVTMITGDTVQTAKAIASKVGIDSQAITMKELHNNLDKDIIAGVFPEDKFHVIHLLQSEGLICGMTGDGVNDAPALKKAEVGIAVSNATDVAKASASLVLTNPGLVDIVKAIKVSRRIYQRMLTYTLNKIIKTFQIAVLLGAGLIATRQFIISPLQIVLLLFANDFMTMSLSADRVSYSPKPDKWNIGRLTFVGGIFAVFMLILSFILLFAGIDRLHLTAPQLQTWIFLTLVFSGQAIIYLVRERKHFWHSLPGKWLIASSLFDIIAVSILAVEGIAMAPIPLHLVFILLILVITYFILLDFIKVRVSRFFRL